MTPDGTTATKPAAATARAVVSELDTIIRDIARGGLAALITGLLVAGLGGRIVMRMAALLVPEAAGRFTENGNRIGEITLGGSVALITFVGVFATIVCGVNWVLISPWLPRGIVRRGVVAAPLAVAAGAFVVIEGSNPDFGVLGHDPIVVASLLVLVALIPIVLSVVDDRLDRRLPPGDRGSGAGRAYVTLAVLGGSLGAIELAQASVVARSRPMAWSVVAVGVLTLIWWRQRVSGRSAPAPLFTGAARAILVLGTIAGLVVLLPELTSALAIR